MTFEEEWAQAQHNAAQSSPSMQLNKLAPVPGAPSGEMKASPSAKKKAATYIEQTLGPNVVKAANKADAESSVVAGSANAPGAMSPGALDGWQTKTGLRNCMSEWERQVKNLQNRLSSEASALRHAGNLYWGNDLLTGRSFHPTGGSLDLPHSKINDL